MKRILKISPSMLFGITISLMIIPYFDNEMEKGKVGFGIWPTLFLSLILLSWYYSIGTFLPKRRPVKSVGWFKFNIFFLFIFLPILCIIVFTNEEIVKENIKLFIFFQIYFFIAFFQILVFCAKLLAFAENHRVPKFSEYFQYVLLLWLFPIGIWVIQPRLNKY